MSDVPAEIMKRLLDGYEDRLRPKTMHPKTVGNRQATAEAMRRAQPTICEGWVVKRLEGTQRTRYWKLRQRNSIEAEKYWRRYSRRPRALAQRMDLQAEAELIAKCWLEYQGIEGNVGLEEKTAKVIKVLRMQRMED